MKRVTILTALLLAGFVTAASAQSKAFSVGISAGLKADQGGLGSTIMDDGGLGTADNTVASQFYGVSDIIMPGNGDMASVYNSDNTNSAFDLLNDTENGGAMTGLELGLQLGYEFNNMGLPLFARTGFNYMMRMSGGEMSRTLGDVVQKGTGYLATLQGAGIMDPTGGKMESNFQARHMEVPVTIGLNINIDDAGKYKAYAGIGVSYFSGGWGVDFQMDEKYVEALTAYEDDSGNWQPGVGGTVDQEVWFKYSGIGVNYLLGISAELATDIHLFFEVSASGIAGLSYSDDLDTQTRKVMTAASSPMLANADEEWYKRLAYPVQLGGATIKFGAKYFVF